MAIVIKYVLGLIPYNCVNPRQSLHPIGGVVDKFGWNWTIEQKNAFVKTILKSIAR